MSYDATCGAAFAYACRMWLKGDTVPQSMRVGTLRALRTDSARAFEAVCRTARWPLVTAPDAREVVAGMTPTADLSGRSETRPMDTTPRPLLPSADGASVWNYENLRLSTKVAGIEPESGGNPLVPSNVVHCAALRCAALVPDVEVGLIIFRRLSPLNVHPHATSPVVRRGHTRASVLGARSSVMNEVKTNWSRLKSKVTGTFVSRSS